MLSVEMEGRALTTKMLVQIRGLRVYVSMAAVQSPGEPPVFYSRRENGPYYRWLYEKAPGRWRPFRFDVSELARGALCIAKWNAVPTALQTRLGEHYIE
jgi:hypothetical protein